MHGPKWVPERIILETDSEPYGEQMQHSINIRISFQKVPKTDEIPTELIEYISEKIEELLFIRSGRGERTH